MHFTLIIKNKPLFYNPGGEHNDILRQLHAYIAALLQTDH